MEGRSKKTVRLAATPISTAMATTVPEDGAHETSFQNISLGGKSTVVRVGLSLKSVSFACLALRKSVPLVSDFCCSVAPVLCFSFPSPSCL